VIVSTPQTWHYGLVAEWWAAFNTDGPEISYFGRFVEQGQPALDAGCGTGRLLLPWLRPDSTSTVATSRTTWPRCVGRRHVYFRDE